jgi:outer membrane autotransporter protein
MGDTLNHTGDLAVASRASVVAEERSAAEGNIEQRLVFGASGRSTGILAGEGDDTVTSSGDVDVSGTAQGTVNGFTRVTSDYFNMQKGVFESRAENVTDVELTGTSSGIELGDGVDGAEIAGNLTVRAAAVPVGEDVARAVAEADLDPIEIFGIVIIPAVDETGARATATNTAVATGVRGESGENRVTISGAIDVGTESVSTTFAQAANVLVADDQSRISSIESAFSFADDALAGTNLDFAGKELRLVGTDEGFTRRDASVTAVDANLLGTQFADSNAIGVDADTVIGTSVRFESSNPQVDDFESEVVGFDVDTGVFTLVDALPTDTNNNPLLATNDPYRLSVQTAMVTDFQIVTDTAGNQTAEFTLDEDVSDVAEGTTYSVSLVSNSQAAGQRTFVDTTRILESADRFENTWISFAGRDGFSTFVVRFEEDTGTFVLSEPIPFELSLGDIYEISTTRNGTSGSTAIARAAGIDLGGGNAVVSNSGAIDVNAAAVARAEVEATFGLADASSDAVAEAVGIRTGNGNDTITNEEAATISVVAEAMSETNTGEQSTSATATGIETGAGDDVVTNNGLISALTNTNGVATSDTGIDLGAGDDALTLGPDSEVIGTITLGDDDDYLTLAGSPVVRDASGAAINPQAGAGSDALVLQGAGAFTGTPTGFERATKTETGMYALPGLAPLESLTIDGGVLQLGSDYDFAEDGDFSTYIHSDGDNGRLSIIGNSVLDGTIDVERRGSTYISDGARYSVVQTTGSLDNAFADVTLPAPTPLLRFDLEQTVNSVDTVATAESFSLVASKPLYRQIARNLDHIADDASGDLAVVLGTLQSLESGFDRAFASASPDSHLVTTRSTVDTGLQMTRLLQNHLDSSRATYRRSLQGPAAFGNVSFAYNNGIGAIGLSSAPAATGGHDPRFMLAANEYSGTGVSQAIPQQGTARGQVWIQGARADGDYDEVDGYTDFDTDSNIVALGYDVRLDERLIVGGTLGYAKTDVDMDKARGESDIKAWSGGAYASWFTDKAYLEGGISYARQSFDNDRKVVVGAIKRTATSDHDGDVWMGFLGSGYQAEFDGWSVEPYGSLYYFNAQEDSFRETGADSMNQKIDDRDTEALVGEVGARVGRQKKLGKGTLDWHASLGLNHDFDIDDARISYSYAGAPGDSFRIDDRDLDNNSAVFGAGVSYTRGSSTISLDYRRQQNDDYDNDAIFAGLVVRF